MILKWTDRDYAHHYLDVGDRVTHLGTYNHDEPRPNYGPMYDRSTFVVADPAKPTGGSLVGEFGDDASGPQDYEWAGTDQISVIVCLLAPDSAGPDDGLLQISCLGMFLVNDHGDTIDTIVHPDRGRR